MVTYVGSTIRVVEPSEQLVQWCKDHLTLPNPDFYKKERMGLWTGKTPETISLWRMGRTEPSHLPILEMPFGVFLEVRHLLENVDIVFGVRERVNYGNPIPLYDYQKQAVDEVVRKRYGILQAPAGCGKTQMGLAVIQKHGYKALWLTHTKDLLNQSKERAERYMDKSLMGTITEGKVDIGKGITFATVQTLAKQDLTQYKYMWDVVIVDECHRVAGTPTSMTQFSKVISNLACNYKYGLSATVHRADGMIKCCYMLLGDVKHIVPDEAVKDKVMAVKIVRVDTMCNMPMSALDTDGTINYTKLISSLANKKARNDEILSHIVSDAEHYHLILSDRLDQLYSIYESLPDELKAQASVIDGSMTSKKGKVEREQAIEDMRAGKKHFLFASYKLAKEGLDIPRLDRLHLATPQKDYAIIVQSVGRIARTFDGKEQPICFDYVDNFKMAENMYKLRCRHYKKCGCVIDGMQK